MFPGETSWGRAGLHVISQTTTIKNIAGLILAAGKSERMGRPKPLLPLAGETFISRIIRNIQSSGLSNWLVVLGHQYEEILAKTKLPSDHTIINSEYELGQLSSLKCGLRKLNSQKLDAVMVFLIDHPLISAPLIDNLARQFSEAESLIVIPTFLGKRGHPVTFGEGLFGELFSAPLDLGAKAILRRHPSDILEVPIEDEGVLVDVDTQSDYEKLVQSFPWRGT